MLDLTILIRRLTQGQPPAEMTLARPAREEIPTGPSGPAAASTSSATQTPAPPAPPADAQAVARRVLELMRLDLALERDRRGRRLW